MLKKRRMPLKHITVFYLGPLQWCNDSIRFSPCMMLPATLCYTTSSVCDRINTWLTKRGTWQAAVSQEWTLTVCVRAINGTNAWRARQSVIAGFVGLHRRLTRIFGRMRRAGGKVCPPCLTPASIVKARCARRQSDVIDETVSGKSQISGHSQVNYLYHVFSIFYCRD